MLLHMKSGELQGQRVVVTGSAGVIGRELLSRLCEAGADVLSWDREPLPAAGPWSGVRHVQSDLSTADLGALRAFSPHIIFHLAAAFERSVEAPAFWEVNWQDNVFVSHRVAEIVRSLDSLKVCVFASSYLIYSRQFDNLPSLMQEHLYQRLYQILNGEDTSPDFQNIAAGTKRAILEILLQTKPGLPDYWKEPRTSAGVAPARAKNDALLPKLEKRETVK